MNPLCKEIHSTPGKGYINFTGGGFRVLADLMGPGGGSSTLLGSIIPYDTRETNDFLGFSPENYSAFEVAEALAMRGFEDAVINLVSAKDDVPAFGLGATASLAKAGDERKGRIHQFHIYGQNEDGDWVKLSWSRPNTEEPKIDRAFEEEFLSDAMIAALYLIKVDDAFDIQAHLRSQGYGTTMLDHLQIESNYLPHAGCHSPALRDLQRRGQAIHFTVDSRGVVVLNKSPWMFSPQDKAAIIPGSYNPYHDGHDVMRTTLEFMTGLDTVMELSLDNATKPSVSWRSLNERIQALQEWCKAHLTRVDMMITRAPLFIHKIQQFPSVTWGMGYDTMVRFLDPKFVDLNELRQAVTLYPGVRFVVFPRNGGTTFPQDAPSWFLERAVMVPNFHVEISSTEIRKAKEVL